MFRALVCLATMALAAPVVAQTQIGTAPAPTAVSAAVPDAANGLPAVGADADYKLGVADHVRLSVYNEPDLSGEFTVSANGSISLPLIGNVNVGGQTASEVAVSVQKKLSDGYLKDPRVSIEVLTYRPYYILGEVTKPGEYPYSNGLTVLNAVATAEGFTYRANKRHVFVKHAGENLESDLRITPGLQIRPGDTIRIGERYF